MDCLLVADDLTGACDAAVHFVLQGLRPALVRLPGQPYASDARVLACSTESRDMAPPEIRQALLDVAAEFSAVNRIFKKIDSTLRGNVGMEVVAAREAFDCATAVVCPAFPAMRRIVDNGMLRAPDFTPLDIAERLSQQSGEVCLHVMPQDLAGALANGARLISVDATSDADLDRIAAILAGKTHDGRHILWAGSAGLASALARHLGAPEKFATRPLARGPVLFCLGSDHPVTLAQQDALAGLHPVLRIPRGRITAAEVREHLATVRPAAIAVSGGDTASLVLRAIGAHAIHLLAEIVPGVPVGLLRGGMFDGLPVVTKSGGFGDRDTLVNVADFFHAPI